MIKEPSLKPRIKLDIVEIKSLFPALDINVGVDEVKKSTPSNIKPASQKQPSQTQQKQAAQAPAPAPAPAPPQELKPATTAPDMVMKDKTKEDEILKSMPPSEIPPGLTIDDILNPDSKELSCCMTFLEKYVEELEKLKQYFVMEGMRGEAKKTEQTWMRCQQEYMVRTNRIGECRNVTCIYLCCVDFGTRCAGRKDHDG